MSTRDLVDEAAEAYRARLADLIDAYGIPQADPATLGETAALTSAATRVWTEYVGPFVDAESAAQLLAGVTKRAVSQRVRARRLLGLRTGSGRIVFPLWEFDGSGVLEGLPAVLDAAGYDPVRPTTGRRLRRTPPRELEPRGAVPTARPLVSPGPRTTVGLWPGGAVPSGRRPAGRSAARKTGSPRRGFTATIRGAGPAGYPRRRAAR